MYRNYNEKYFILDDEKYFSLSGCQMNGNDIYYTSNNSNVSYKVKYKAKKKFERKLMLYIAISKEGISKPFFCPSGLAVNKEVYINSCLKKVLLPFIREKHSEKPIIFWPDKASSHYARDSIRFLIAKSVPFVPKIRNPTNVPQIRPIEDLFGFLATEVYKGGWSAKDLPQLKRRIKKCLNEIDLNIVHTMCSKISTFLRKVGREGPYSCCH
jgi:hypothetical protein